MKPISCVRLGSSVNTELDRAAEQLSLPKAQVMRLAIIAGLPLVLRAVPQPQPQPQGGTK
jgi:hypothetical protein